MQQMDDVGQRKGHCEPTAGEDLASTNEASTSRTVCSVDYDPVRMLTTLEHVSKKTKPTWKHVSFE